MSRKENTSRWLKERYCTQQELIETLVEGLDRSLTHQEIDALYWIIGCHYETRGIILDIFKELVKKQRRT